MYKVPRNHDTVVINDAGRVIRSYKSGGFYSDEETAKRREANRLLYEPHREPPPNMKRALARQQEPVEDEFFG